MPAPARVVHQLSLIHISQLTQSALHLLETGALRPLRAYLCLGGIAWKELHRALGIKPPAFSHGAEARTPSGALILGSYHPSQQNTFTGRLTEAMLDDVMQRFAAAVRA